MKRSLRGAGLSGMRGLAPVSSMDSNGDEAWSLGR